MKISENGLKIIKNFEGCVLKPYLCSAGVPTIGYGSTYWKNGERVSMTDKPISLKQAEDLLVGTVKHYENCVNCHVKSVINQNQFDALVSFTYNIGDAGFASSTLLKKVNINPADKQIVLEFAKWVYAGKNRSDGLIRRRRAEAELYFKEA